MRSLSANKLLVTSIAEQNPDAPIHDGFSAGHQLSFTSDETMKGVGDAINPFCLGSGDTAHLRKSRSKLESWFDQYAISLSSCLSVRSPQE